MLISACVLSFIAVPEGFSKNQFEIQALLYVTMPYVPPELLNSELLNIIFASGVQFTSEVLIPILARFVIDFERDAN